MRHGLDRMAEQLAADRQDLADDLRRHAALGYLERRLDHRQGEALDAETVVRKVALLRLE
ncbi:hypothetical protein D3C72_1963980 [compost metagenome]